MIQNSERNLGEIFQLCWRNKRDLLVALTAGLALGVILLLVLRPQYEARMIVAPAIHDYGTRASTDRSLSNLITERDESGSGEFIKFEQIFREASVAQKLMNHVNFLSAVNADGKFKFTHQDISDASEFADYLKREITIRPLGATSSRLITYRHSDPLFAAQFLQALHDQADALIRKEAQSKTAQRISYLQNELQGAINPDHRQILADLLVEEEQQRMLSSMDAPYAAEIVEPPSVSLKKSFPRSCVVLPICLLIGLVLGCMRVLLRNPA